MSTQNAHKEWANMSKEERHLLTMEKRAQAKEKVQSGAFPPALRITIGGKDYLATPSGVSEKGSVAYAIGPMAIEVKGRPARINKINISLLNTGEVEVNQIDLSQVL